MNRIYIVVGPTASGKTKLAIDLAEEINAEIVNADSLQVYKENPIISAQPTLQERRGIQHHLFGYISGKEEYLITRWLNDVKSIIENTSKSLVLVGGTGFYLKHLIFGLAEIPQVPDEVRSEVRGMHLAIGNEEFYKVLSQVDPIVADKISSNDYKRMLRAYEVIKFTGKSILQWQRECKYSALPLENVSMIILEPERKALYEKINKRFIHMLDNGVMEEVKKILDMDCEPSRGIMKSHGIPELVSFIRGEIKLEEAIAKAQQVTRNYAKRQTTWFKHQFNDSNLKKRVLLDSSFSLLKDWVYQ